MMAVETRSTTSTVAAKQDVNELSGKLDKVMENLGKRSSAITELNLETRELHESQQFMSEQYEDMKRTLVFYWIGEGLPLWKLGPKNRVLTTRRCFLSDPKKLERSWAQYGRRECHEFQGLAWSNNENIDELLTSGSKFIEVDLSVKDCSAQTLWEVWTQSATNYHRKILF